MITKGNKIVTDIFFGDKHISKIYKGEIMVFNSTKEESDIPLKTTTLVLDQNQSDPTKMISGVLGKDGNPKRHVISYIRANSHRYVGTYDAELGMILRQLDDNDSTKYANGDDASVDITTKDVFMKMPDFWFRGEEIETDVYNMHFRAVEPNDGKSWVKWDGNTLIGVYKVVAEDTGDNTNGGLYSRSDVTPTTSVSQKNFKAKARNRSNGDDHFMLVTYEAHQVMGLLYMTYYGNMNGQKVIGAGTSKYPKVTGQTNVDGMNDTVAENTRSINFWGLENWWGDTYEWMDNLVTADKLGTININDYDGNIKRQAKASTATLANYITKMLLGEQLDLFPTNISKGSATTYYCSRGDASSGDGRVGERSFDKNTEGSGPFLLMVDGLYYARYDFNSSRLLYQGRVTIEE